MLPNLQTRLALKELSLLFIPGPLTVDKVSNVVLSYARVFSLREGRSLRYCGEHCKCWIDELGFGSCGSDRSFRYLIDCLTID